MDKFEELIQEVMQMSESDRNIAIENYKGSCICHTCATYNQCAADKMKNYSVSQERVRIV